MTPRPPLLRERSNALGGVSEAVALHLGWKLGTVRFAFIASTLLGGAGALLYLWLWALVPLVPDDAAPVTRRAPVAALLVGAGAIAAIIVATAATGADALATNALIAVVLTIGAAVAWSLTLDRTDPDRTREYALWVRGLGSGILLVTGLVVLLSRPAAINAVLAVGLIVLGVGVVVAPRVVALWAELQASQTARVRDEQRAEIAAHLHDSVLQTLALIQNRAGASSEVARIARAQERELRDWLFTGSAPVDADLASELREIAALIELDYAVRIDVVAVGEFGPSPSALVAAAREAMLNAARHAGGEVSVYLESTVSAIDVFVRDRGPGVDLDSVPDDRLGIRESIIGRMSRAGGSATIGVGADGTGTEIHLHLEVPHD
ncbi:PspC domain-containing protein [Glaciihabitans arcticus]|uniref:PspC domain-containing protein n=1 Tax=Glaciihabitans arcticus TaxID=2668039 RepID=UPI001EFFAAC4|nr:PspC domain-containing protein [Glaciihabitans arcticus]